MGCIAGRCDRALVSATPAHGRVKIDCFGFGAGLGRSGVSADIPASGEVRGQIQAALATAARRSGVVVRAGLAFSDAAHGWEEDDFSEGGRVSE